MVVAGALGDRSRAGFPGHPAHDLLLVGDLMAGVDDAQIEFVAS